MSLHADEQFLAAVAAALGETIALVRRRGFHLEPAAANGDPRAADSCSRHRHVEDDDVLDLSVKRDLWANRFTAADRRKFAGPEKEVLKQHHTIELWHIARSTPTPNQCIVEAAYAVGLINESRRESLLDALGAKPRAGKIGKQRSAAVPHWDAAARELRFRGKVVRVVKRPKQAHNIVTILRAFEAAGWPPRIDDPHGRKSSDETRRRDMSNLNRGLDTSLMKFECDGDGTGFLWKKIPQPQTAKSAKRRKR